MSTTISRSLSASRGLIGTSSARTRSVSSENSRRFRTSLQSSGQTASTAASRNTTAAQSTTAPQGSQETVTYLGPWRFVATQQTEAQSAGSLQSRWSVMAANAQPAAVPAATAAAATTAGSASATPVSSDPVDVLRAELKKKGINSDELSLTYEERPCFYPGGGYIDKVIVAEIGDVKESFSVDLMLKNPWLTALEVGRMMARA